MSGKISCNNKESSRKYDDLWSMCLFVSIDLLFLNTEMCIYLLFLNTEMFVYKRDS